MKITADLFDTPEVREERRKLYYEMAEYFSDENALRMGLYLYDEEFSYWEPAPEEMPEFYEFYPEQFFGDILIDLEFDDNPERSTALLFVYYSMG